MIRSFIPFFLASLGLAMIFFVSTNALFEWQISDVVTDVPSSYEVHVFSSPWKTRISDVLSDKTYIFSKLLIQSGDQYCSSKAFNIAVQRSRKDEIIERLILLPQLSRSGSDWRVWWALSEIAISMVYLMWFTVWQKPRTFTYIVISWMFAIISFCLIMIPTMKLMGPRVGFVFDGNASCQGIIMFSAKLVKVDYTVLMAWLVGASAELGALVMMVHQVVKVARIGKESSKLAVG